MSLGQKRRNRFVSFQSKADLPDAVDGEKCQKATLAGGVDGAILGGYMQFEKVHTIRELYDGIRSGTADFRGAPYYFACIFDEKMVEYTQHFRLYPVSAQFMEREFRHWAIYRAWEAKFHRGLEPLATHPGHGGIVPEYDEVNEWLNEQMKVLTPIPSVYTATFRVLPGQEELPVGILRALEVAWEVTSA